MQKFKIFRRKDLLITRGNFNRFLKVLILFVALVTCYSCEYDPVLKPSNIETEGSYLTFQDSIEFGRTYKMLANDDNDLSFAKQNNLTSISQVLEDVEEIANEADATISKIKEVVNNTSVLRISEDSSIEPIIEDHIMCRLINDEGLLQIGDTLYHFSYNKIRAIKVDSETGLPVISVEEAKNFEESNEALGITVFTIERNISNSYNSSKLEGCKSFCTVEYSSGRRLKGKLWKVNLWFIKAAGAYTKSQKKKWGLWIGTKASSIEVRVRPSGFNYVYNERSNKKSAHLLTSFSVWGGTGNGQVPDVSTPLDGYHWVNDYKCGTCQN